MRKAAALSLDLDLGLDPALLLPAVEPPEVRGTGRDDIRLLVQDPLTGKTVHRQFRELPTFLSAGDLLVLNRSATLKAALPALCLREGKTISLHVARREKKGVWIAEPRSEEGDSPYSGLAEGEFLSLGPRGEGPILEVLGRVDPHCRLWRLSVRGADRLEKWMARFGRPIRYAYVKGRWPIEAYQTVFATVPGSAEMPSAGRPLTWPLLQEIRARGVEIAWVVLHTALSSEDVEGELDDHFILPEPFFVPGATVRRVARTRKRGGRVIAGGTTVVRALESAVGKGGRLYPRQGLAEAVISPGNPPVVVDGLLTGLHTPRSSHLAMLEAFAAPDLLQRAYGEAVAQGYLWHEFGDAHLILPSDSHGSIGLT